MKKNALGRGLDILIPENDTDRNEVRQISIYEIDRNESQPRKKFEEESLSALSESIRSVGILQPLIVTETDGRYSIVAGERRFRAARLAGLDTVPCIIREMTENEKMEAALIENLQREDLNPIDEAYAIRQLIEKCGYTQDTAAKRLGKSRPALTNLLRLLSLPEDIMELVRKGELTEGHARVICSIGEIEEQRSLARTIISSGMSVRAAEDYAAAMKAKARLAHTKKVLPPEITDFESRLRQTIGVKTKIAGDLKKGKIILQYSSADDLERIYQALEYLENR